MGEYFTYICTHMQFEVMAHIITNNPQAQWSKMGGQVGGSPNLALNFTGSGASECSPKGYLSMF